MSSEVPDPVNLPAALVSELLDHHPPIKALARRHLEEGHQLLLREAPRERPCPFHSVQEQIAVEQLQGCPQLPTGTVPAIAPRLHRDV